MIEVELKIKIDKNKIDEFRSKIEKLGFKKQSLKKEIDIYFNGIDRDFRKTDEALRIRKSINLEKSNEAPKNIITYKGKKLDGISKTREEIEITVDNGENAQKIFEKLGFKPVNPIVKIRETYKNEKDNIVITIDNVEKVGTFAEFEIVVPNISEKEYATNKLLLLLDKLSISRDNLLTKSYLSMRDNNG